MWHGIIQIIEKAIGQQKCEYGWFGKSIKIFITFQLVNFSMIFVCMPSLGDACGVIAHIFDVHQSMVLEITSKHIFVLMMIGTILLFIKDWTDEFAPNKLRLFENKNHIVRWASYLSVIILILLTGVFDAGQFIYANF
jgi:hypothetical protein